MYDDYTYQMAESSSHSSQVLGIYAWIVAIAIWFYIAFMQYKIAHRTGPSDLAWWAFIPILNTFLLMRMAGKPWHWFFILLIPFVNIVAFFMLWIATAKNAGVSGVWGFLALVPMINLLALFIMAYSSRGYEYPDFDDSPPPPPQRPMPERRIIQ